jgi:4-hydroxy-tetrahydrodipicolinate reductase
MPEVRRLVFAGADGRMGRALLPLLEADPTIEIVARVEWQDDLRAAVQRTGAAYVLDFTTPEAVAANARALLEGGAHGIIGTTGLAAAERPALDALARARGRALLVAPNLSITMVLLQQMAERLVPWLPRVEVIESHHEGKRDAPSGTSRRTAERLAAAGALPGPTTGDATPRGLDVGGVRVHSLRLPGIHARQEVRLASEHEGVTLVHEAFSRACYLGGIRAALAGLPGRVGLLEGLEAVL